MIVNSVGSTTLVSHTVSADEFCQTSSEQAQAAYKLIDSNFFLEHSTLILSHIIQNHALRATSADDLLMVYSLLIYAGKEDPRWMKYIVSDARRDKQNLLFRKIIREIESGFGSIKWMAAAVVLVFEMSKVSRVRAADLGENLLFDNNGYSRQLISPFLFFSLRNHYSILDQLSPGYCRVDARRCRRNFQLRRHSTDPGTQRTVCNGT